MLKTAAGMAEDWSNKASMVATANPELLTVSMRLLLITLSLYRLFRLRNKKTVPLTKRATNRIRNDRTTKFRFSNIIFLFNATAV